MDIFSYREKRGETFNEKHKLDEQRKSELQGISENYLNENSEIDITIEAENMSEEEIKAAYTNKLENRAMEGYNGDANSREAKKLRKRARSRMSAINQTRVAMIGRVNDTADKLIEKAGGFRESVQCARLAEYVVPKGVKLTKLEKKELESVKKIAPLVYQRLVRFESLYLSAFRKENDINENVERFGQNMKTYIETSYFQARREWESVQEKINRLCRTTEDKPDAKLEKTYLEERRRNVENGLATNMYGRVKKINWSKYAPVGPGISIAMDDDLKISLRHTEIDWNKSEEEIDKEIAIHVKRRDNYIRYKNELITYIDDENESHEETLELENEDWKEENTYIARLEREKFIRRQVAALIAKEKEENPNSDITPQKVEKTVNAYLKKVADGAELRMRASEMACMKIINGRSCSAPSDAYDRLLSYYSPSVDFNSTGNLAFGYLGGNEAHGAYNTDGAFTNNRLESYGKISLKLNKQKMKGKVSFFVGNSSGNYEKQLGRSLDNPDMFACGENLASVYKRAKEVVEHNAPMYSAEQEGIVVTSNDPSMKYFEANYFGRVSATEIDEMTYTVQGEFPKNMGELKLYFKDEVSDKIRGLLEFLKVVNSHLDEYDREVPIKLSVWDEAGNTIGYEEIKYLMK